MIKEILPFAIIILFFAFFSYSMYRVITNPKVSNIIEKSYKIIDSKLDEMLQSIGGEK